MVNDHTYNLSEFKKLKLNFPASCLLPPLTGTPLNYSSRTKKDISNYDFSQFARGTLTLDSLEAFKSNSTWILPQLLALLGSRLQLVRENGLISFSKTLISLGSGDITFDNGLQIDRLTLQGMLKVLTHQHRSHFVHGRLTSDFGLRYNSSVPLILSAMKQYRGVGYSEWDWADEKRAFFLDPDFVAIADMIGNFANPFSKDELVEARGDVDPTTYKAVAQISKYADLDFKKLPRLAKLMLTQVWVYHPAVRHPLAITDLAEPDEQAESIVADSVLDPWSGGSPWGVSTPNPKRKAVQQEVADIPWDV